MSSKNNQDPATPELADTEQPFISHLVELRDRLLRIVLVVAVVFLALMPFSNTLFSMLSGPLMAHLPKDSSMIAIEVASPFLIPFKLTLFLALFISIPWVLYQAWSFIAPGLYKKEKALAIPFIIASTIFFAGGAIFGYKFVFPEAFVVLLGFSDETLVATLFVKDYMPFFRNMLLSFGVVFEVPVIVTFLAGAGIVTWKQLLKFSRWWIICASFISMILTPADVTSMVMMLVPLVILYYVGVACAYFISVFQKKPAN